MLYGDQVMLARLDDVVAYENRPVVKRFQKDFPNKADRAEAIFKDLMRFFWASKKHDQDQTSNPDDPSFDFIFIMDEEMREIDQMWHVFLLYTNDYMDFCQKYFGVYLHHLPDIVETLPDNPAPFEKNLEKFLSYVYDNLGEDTVERWFAESGMLMRHEAFFRPEIDAR